MSLWLTALGIGLLTTGGVLLASLAFLPRNR